MFWTAHALVVRVAELPRLARKDQPADELPVDPLGTQAGRTTRATNRPRRHHRLEQAPATPMQRSRVQRPSLRRVPDSLATHRAEPLMRGSARHTRGRRHRRNGRRTTADHKPDVYPRSGTRRTASGSRASRGKAVRNACKADNRPFSPYGEKNSCRGSSLASALKKRALAVPGARAGRGRRQRAQRRRGRSGRFCRACRGRCSRPPLRLERSPRNPDRPLLREPERRQRAALDRAIDRTRRHPQQHGRFFDGQVFALFGAYAHYEPILSHGCGWIRGGVG